MPGPAALTSANPVVAYRDASTTNAVKIDAPNNAKARARCVKNKSIKKLSVAEEFGRNPDPTE